LKNWKTEKEICSKERIWGHQVVLTMTTVSHYQLNCHKKIIRKINGIEGAGGHGWGEWLLILRLRRRGRWGGRGGSSETFSIHISLKEQLCRSHLTSLNHNLHASVDMIMDTFSQRESV
jgi:hypothetical protein